jgi:hypothetical protein
MKPLPQQFCLWLVVAAALATLGSGCWSNPSAHTVSRNYSQGQAPVDPPPGHEGCAFDDVTSGGKLFKMYCGSCHNARPLAERPFANYEVAVAHMREQAYLTGKEYRQLIHFLRRWHDIGPATPDVHPSPKRFFFSQPLSELRDPSATTAAPPDGSSPKR